MPAEGDKTPLHRRIRQTDTGAIRLYLLFDSLLFGFKHELLFSPGINTKAGAMKLPLPVFR
jgi:hypothetical protein